MDWNARLLSIRLERTVWQVRVSGAVAMVEAGEGREEIRSDFRPKVWAETGR